MTASTSRAILTKNSSHSLSCCCWDKGPRDTASSPSSHFLKSVKSPVSFIKLYYQDWRGDRAFYRQNFRETTRTLGGFPSKSPYIHPLSASTFGSFLAHSLTFILIHLLLACPSTSWLVPLATAPRTFSFSNGPDGVKRTFNLSATTSILVGGPKPKGAF